MEYMGNWAISEYDNYKIDNLYIGNHWQLCRWECNLNCVSF